MNVYDIPDEVEGWMDRQLLAFADVSRIENDDFTLVREDETWRIAAPSAWADAREVAQDKLDELLTSLQELRVTGLAESLDPVDDESSSETGPALENATNATSQRESSSDDNAGEADENTLQTATWRITESDGEPLTMTLRKQGSEVTVQRSDRPQLFSAPVSLFTSLGELDVDALLPEAASEAATTVDGDGPVDAPDQEPAVDESTGTE